IRVIGSCQEDGYRALGMVGRKSWRSLDGTRGSNFWTTSTSVTYGPLDMRRVLMVLMNLPEFRVNCSLSIMTIAAKRYYRKSIGEKAKLPKATGPTLIFTWSMPPTTVRRRK